MSSTYRSKGPGAFSAAMLVANSIGRSIDPASSIELDDWQAEWSDARDLLEQVVAHPRGARCFAERYATFLLGREIEDPETPCFVQDTLESLLENDLDVRMAAATIAAHEDTLARRD